MPVIFPEIEIVNGGLPHAAFSPLGELILVEVVNGTTCTPLGLKAESSRHSNGGLADSTSLTVSVHVLYATHAISPCLLTQTQWVRGACPLISQTI